MNTMKCMYLFLSVFYAVQQSDDFVLLTPLRPAGSHLPGPSDAVDTEITCIQQRTISWNKLLTRECTIRLLYYNYNVLESLDIFVFINEWHKSMVSSGALIGTSEYPALQTKCCLSRWDSNSVRPYTKRLKLQTNEEYTVNCWSISQTMCRSDRKCDWRYITPKYSTLEHTKYLIYTLHFNCKGNVLGMVFL